MLFKSASNLSWDAITADSRDKATVRAPRLLHARSGLIASTLYLRLIEVRRLKSLVAIHQLAGSIKPLTGRGAETQGRRGRVGRGEAPRETPVGAGASGARLGRGAARGCPSQSRSLRASSRAIPHVQDPRPHTGVPGEGCASPLPGSTLPGGQPGWSVVAATAHPRHGASRAEFSPAQLRRHAGAAAGANPPGWSPLHHLLFEV